MAFVLIKRCYDSHVHWPEVGEIQSYLDLTDVSSIEDLHVKFKSLKLPISSDQWIRGFGWDEYKFSNKDFLTTEFLNSYFPNHPVSLIRADGHSVWVNTKAIQLSQVGISKNKAVFSENEKMVLDNCIPEYSEEELKDFFLLGQDTFVKNGFTHIRDMGFTLKKWKVAKQLCEDGALKLFAEVNFVVNRIDELQNVIELALIAKEESKLLKHLRVSGIKFYVDGSLGSETALLSKPYVTSLQSGIQLFSDQDLQEMIFKIWKSGFPVSVHALGDEAVDKVVDQALHIQEKFAVKGELNIEHAELIKSETLEKMQNLNLRVHFQPTHFLSDLKWFDKKIAPLKENLFRWNDLERLQIPFSFGSDAPIEKPNFYNTKLSLQEAAKQGISTIKMPIEKYFEHPDIEWGAHSFTKFFEDGTIQRNFEY